jgi:electron transfer flavoprotein beta subunit
MEIGVCVKRVPMVGGKIVLTEDAQEVDTRMSGFTISPHEECAVEEAVRITERLGGTVSVITLGPPAAADQLRDALALGAKRAVLLETDGREWGPVATTAAIVAEVRRHAADGPGYDLLLCGNEAADTGDYQVGVRVACALGWPCVTGIKNLEISQDAAGGPVTEERGPEPSGGSGPSGARGWPPEGGVSPRAGRFSARASREYRGGAEAFEFALPAVICVKEGINLPRYPSLPGRLRAKRAEIERHEPQWQAEGLRKRSLRVPAAQHKQATVLGTGAGAVPALLGVLEEWGLLP